MKIIKKVLVVDLNLSKVTPKNLIVTKADKGNSVIILNYVDFIKKTMDFFNGDNFEMVEINPTNKL